MTTACFDNLPISVITTCQGRNRHLYNLLSSLAHSSAKPAEVIIINDDANPARLATYPLHIVQIPTFKAQGTLHLSAPTKDNSNAKAFDIGRNRNLGAQQATYEAMIFLDVDCIVAPTFIEHFYKKLQAYPKALLMGQPRYLTRPLTDNENFLLQQGLLPVERLNGLSVYNPYRDNIAEAQPPHVATTPSTAVVGIKKTEDYGAFWSLCFAIMRPQFAQIGGFDTTYVGYGAEDTDFAFMARQLTLDFYLTDDVIYHQQHGVYRPPLNHLDSIVVNANRFYEKWHHWPMAGWLMDFAHMQLIEWQTDQTSPIQVKRQPNSAEIAAAHCPNAPYV